MSTYSNFYRHYVKVLTVWLASEGTIFWTPGVSEKGVFISVRTSVLPLSGCFLGIVSLVFSNFGRVLQIHMKLCIAEPDFFENVFFAPKIGKMGQKWSFLILLKDLVINFYWICSIMKNYIIYCVPAPIPYLGKFLFLGYGQKCSQPIRLQEFLINHISRLNQWNSLIFCTFTQVDIKVYQNFFGWA